MNAETIWRIYASIMTIYQNIITYLNYVFLSDFIIFNQILNTSVDTVSISLNSIPLFIISYINGKLIEDEYFSANVLSFVNAAIGWLLLVKKMQHRLSDHVTMMQFDHVTINHNIRILVLCYENFFPIFMNGNDQVHSQVISTLLCS